MGGANTFSEGASLDVTSGYVSPTGDNDAYKFDLVVGTGGVLFTNNITLDSATDHTLSVWLKGEVGGEKVRVDLKNTSSAGVSGSFFTVTNEWQRYEVTVTADATNRGFQFRLTASNGVSDQTLYVYGPQLEEGTTASSFVANTTGSAKFTGISATYAPRVPMILCEPSATNNLIYSEDFSHPGWTKVNDVVITPSSVDAPDGTTNAFKLSELQLTDGDYGLSEFLNTTPSTSYTFSAYFKATSDSDVGKKVTIRIRRSVGTSISASESVTLTSEWVRHSVTIDLLSDNTACWFVITKDISSPTAERADECLLWGAQVETGSVMTSYIPVLSGSTVTRAADDLVITGSDFDFYNQSEGTVYAEFVPKRVDNYRHLFEFSNGTTSNRMNVNLLSSNAIFYIRTGGSDTVNNVIASNVATEELHRIACSYKNNDARASFDGGSEIIDTVVTLPPQHTKMFIGDYTPRDGNYILTGHIKRIIYWPTHSSRL